MTWLLVLAFTGLTFCAIRIGSAGWASIRLRFLATSAAILLIVSAAILILVHALKGLAQ